MKKTFTIVAVLSSVFFVSAQQTGLPPDSAPASTTVNLLASTPLKIIPTITWTDKSTNEDGFIIERKVSASTTLPYTYLTTIPSNLPSYQTGPMMYVDETLNDEYFDMVGNITKPLTTSAVYRITAFNKYGSKAGGWAAVSPSTLTVSAAPANVKADTLASTPLKFIPTINWTDMSTNEDGFIIERKVGGASSTPFSYLTTIPSNLPSYQTGPMMYVDETADEAIRTVQYGLNSQVAYRVSSFNRYGTKLNSTYVVAKPPKTVSFNSTVPGNDIWTVAQHVGETINDANDFVKEKGASLVANLFSTTKVSANTSSSCIKLDSNLHRGFENSAVLLLQKFLVQKGFLSEQPSGFYGDLTIAAVKAYQKSLGLPETGMVYDFTRQMIKSETCDLI